MKTNKQEILELRTLTGAGVMDCKRALDATNGDAAKTLALLREKAEQAAKQQEQKATKVGYVHAYIHGDGRIGMLIEARCETDFLSMNREFRSLIKELALHIASEAPRYVQASDVPPEIIEQIEAEVEATAHGKPPGVIEKIRSGRVRKFIRKSCLMEQPYVKNPDVSVGSLVQALSAKSGERIQIVRFSRYQADQLL